MAGILLQWYGQVSVSTIIVSAIIFSTSWLLFSLFSLAVRFKFQFFEGVSIHGILLSLGLFICWQKDIRHNRDWFGQYYHDSDYLVVRVDEPVIEKAKSYKANGVVESVVHGNNVTVYKGKILLYFSKDSVPLKLQYGDRILISKKLQQIKNSGNPGAFNYERYAAFQQIFHNVYLKRADYVILTEKDINHFQQFIFVAREGILNILRSKISSGKDELGIAEALLIGYTNDLDKDLVQAYSNTGVVHIIAISGMHLGLIYVMLVWIFAKMPLINRSKIVQVILILCCLWLFSLLTGAAASVTRAAVMFTFITVGANFKRRSSIYNSLAASAFVMLCYNPFFLWDVGFQLSYLAVIGIIIFQKPIYNWFYIKNKWIDNTWKLLAISLSAQVLTFPVCIYYFHQFPNLFLITNLIAVPLSSLVLYAEIGLVALYGIPVAGAWLGKITGWLVWLMNHVILWISRSPFAVWDGIHATTLSTLVLYALVIALCAWLLNKNKGAFRFALFCALAFAMIFSKEIWDMKSQQKLIVYNVPQHEAIDFVSGNSYWFIGDSILLVDGVLQNFHLKPARISLQLNRKTDSISELFTRQKFYYFSNRKIIIIDQPIAFETPPQKIDVDIIIIAKNPKLKIAQLANVFNCRQFIFDASNSPWKIVQWQNECRQLNLSYHSIPDEGAFVYDIPI